MSHYEDQATPAEAETEWKTVPHQALAHVSDPQSCIPSDTDKNESHAHAPDLKNTPSEQSKSQQSLGSSGKYIPAAARKGARSMKAKHLVLKQVSHLYIPLVFKAYA